MSKYFIKTPQGRFEPVTPGKPLGEPGGQGAVYRIASPSNHSKNCIKVYHDYTKFEYDRIDFMLKNPPQINNQDRDSFQICWPLDIAYDEHKRAIGYIMPLAFDGSRTMKILEGYTINKTIADKFKKDVEWHGKFERHEMTGINNRIKMMHNWALAVYRVHEVGCYVLVDLKPENVLATPEGKISIIDTDSFQITNSRGNILFKGPVATAKYFSIYGYNLNKLNQPMARACDRFAIAVVFYQILIGSHPYAGTINRAHKKDVGYSKYFDECSQVEECIQARLFAYGDNKKYFSLAPGAGHENFQNLPQSIKDLFILTFNGDGSKAPSLIKWIEAFRDAITSIDQGKSTIKPIAKPKINVKPIPITHSVNTQYNPYLHTAPQTSQNKTPLNTSPVHSKDRTPWILWLLFVAAVIGGVYYFLNRSMVLDSVPMESTVSATTIYRCSAIELNVRYAPDLTSKIVGKLKQDEAVEVYEALGRFAKINYNGTVAYASTKFLIDDNGQTIWANLPSSVRSAEDKKDVTTNNKNVTTTDNKVKDTQVANQSAVNNSNLPGETIDEVAKLQVEVPEVLDTKIIFTSKDYAFMGAPVNCSIPHGVIRIEESAFSNRSKLQSVTISTSVQSIGNKAFSYCISLESIKIPNSVNSVGSQIFEGCDPIVFISETSPVLDEIKAQCSNVKVTLSPFANNNNNNSNTNKKVSSVQQTASKTASSKKYTTVIAKSFHGNYKTSHYDISDDYTSIASNAFSGDPKVRSVKIPNTVKSIGDRAFYSCVNLTTVNIPNSVTHIGNNAFKVCYQLKSVTIPNSVTSIGEDVFSHTVKNKTIIYISKSSPIYDKLKKEYRSQIEVIK